MFGGFLYIRFVSYAQIIIVSFDKNIIIEFSVRIYNCHLMVFTILNDDLILSLNPIIIMHLKCNCCLINNQ